MNKVIIDDKTVRVEDTKLAVGLAAINKPTPVWAKWIFRGTLIVTTVLSAWVAATGLVAPEVKNEILLVFKGLDALAFGASKMFGLKLDEDK